MSDLSLSPYGYSPETCWRYFPIMTTNKGIYPAKAGWFLIQLFIL